MKKQDKLPPTIAFHVDFGYSLLCRFTPKQHEERALPAYRCEINEQKNNILAQKQCD
jgi:hypothetical protein